MEINMSEFVREYIDTNGQFYLKYLYRVLGFVDEGGRDFSQGEFIQEIDGDLFFQIIVKKYGLEFFVDRWHGDHLLKKIGNEYLQIIPREHSETGRSQYQKYKTLEEAVRARVLYDLKRLGIRKIYFMGETHRGFDYYSEKKNHYNDEKLSDQINHAKDSENKKSKLPTNKLNRGQFNLTTK